MSQQVSITRACINPPGRDDRSNYNAEWVELQVGSAADLDGFRVEHLINPDTNEQAWSLYYLFGDGERFPAGSRIRIHSGAGEARKDEHGVFLRFVADAGEKGQWRLNNTGDALKVLDASQVKLDEKAFNGDEGYCGAKGHSSSEPGHQKKPQTQYARG